MISLLEEGDGYPCLLYTHNPIPVSDRTMPVAVSTRVDGFASSVLLVREMCTCILGGVLRGREGGEGGKGGQIGLYLC